jgi:hypothetical protein
MYVDCAGDYIIEAYNGNTYHLDRLLDFAQSACFTHISLYRLDLLDILSDPNLALLLSDFINDCHSANITVGAVGSDSAFYTENFVSDPTWTPDYDFCANPEFFTGDQIAYLEPIVNPKGDRSSQDLYDKFVEAEIAKFYLRTGVDYNAYHTGKFDVLSLEIEYWGRSPSPFVAYIKYSRFINLLKLMNTIKDLSKNILNIPLIIEAEVGHLDNNKLVLYEVSPGVYVTPQYQAEEIDSLTDRILLISYRYYPNNLFSKSCEWINLFGQTNKANTVIWPLLSAEAFTGDTNTGAATNVWDSSVVNHWYQQNCNTVGGIPWNNYLGDYLIENAPDGLTLAEDYYFINYDIAIATQPCSTCCPNCTTCVQTWSNGDNAAIDTVMWFTYTLLDDPDTNYHSSSPWYRLRSNNLKKNESNYLEIIPNPTVKENVKLKVKLNIFEKHVSLQIFNFKSQLVYSADLSKSSDEMVLSNVISPGMYFCKLIVDGELSDVKKLIVINEYK